MLVMVQIPQHSLAILTTRGSQRTIGRDGHGVEVSIVSEVVGLQFTVGQVPHLNDVVPSGTHQQRVLGVGAEPNTANPLRMAVLLDGVLALSQGVPQLDRLVS